MPDYAIDDRVDVKGKASGQWHRGIVYRIDTEEIPHLYIKRTEIFVRLTDPKDAGEILVRQLGCDSDLIRHVT